MNTNTDRVNIRKSYRLRSFTQPYATSSLRQSSRTCVCVTDVTAAPGPDDCDATTATCVKKCKRNDTFHFQNTNTRYRSSENNYAVSDTDIR